MIREAHKVVMTSASFLPKRLLLNTIIFHDVQIENFQVIDTLEEGITMLGGEKYSTGSCVLPFLKKMEKDLEYKEDDPVFISKFKTELWSDLEKRCLENLNQRLLAKAAFFDKRFSNLKFLEEEKKAVLDEVMAEVKVVEENSKRQQLARQGEKIHHHKKREGCLGQDCLKMKRRRWKMPRLRWQVTRLNGG